MAHYLLAIGNMRRNISIVLPTLGLLALFLVPGRVLAQKATLDGTLGGGTGASFGQGQAETIVKLSPVFIEADVIIGNDERPKLEYVVGFQAELQDRVTAGIIPQIRITTGPQALMVYGMVGVPFIFAPKRLFGLEAGPGFLWNITPTVGLFLEIAIDIFFLGNDLPKDSILLKIDGTLGVRISFQ